MWQYNSRFVGNVLQKIGFKILLFFVFYIIHKCNQGQLYLNKMCLYEIHLSLKLKSNILGSATLKKKYKLLILLFSKD